MATTLTLRLYRAEYSEDFTAQIENGCIDGLTADAIYQEHHRERSQADDGGFDGRDLGFARVQAKRTQLFSAQGQRRAY